MITCAMCDDELPFAEQLRSLVMAYAKKKRVELQAETFASAEELLEEIENVVNLLCRDIVYLESNKRKVIVHTVRGEYEYYHKLDEAEEELLAISADFVRIHKAYLVNMEHVEAFQYEKLALRDGTILSISEAHRANVRSRFWEWGSE